MKLVGYNYICNTCAQGSIPQTSVAMSSEDKTGIITEVRIAHLRNASNDGVAGTADKESCKFKALYSM